MSNLNPGKIVNNLVIELHVPDFNQVREFYEKLDFKIPQNHPKANYPGYMVMRRNDKIGDTTINFYGDSEKVYEQAYFKNFSPQTPRGYAVEITIPVADVADVYKKVKEEIPNRIVRELKKIRDDYTTWSDFRLVDPFGFYVRFTELVDWGQ